MPIYSEYLITTGLVVACVILKLNVFPRVSANLPRKFLVAFLCGITLVNLYVYQIGVEERLVKPLDDKGFADLRRALGHKGRVGFISDETIDDSSVALERYFQTQYGLAPIVLVEGTSPDLIVGNFDKVDPELVPDDLVLVQVFGPGLMLLRKRVQ